MLRISGIPQGLRALKHQRRARNIPPSSPILSTTTWATLRVVHRVFQFLLFGIFFNSSILIHSVTHGPSMLPTINATGDVVLISRLSKRGKNVKVGDVVNFENPMQEGGLAIKRIAAMPGDFVVWNYPAGDGEFEMGEGGLIVQSKGLGADIWAEGMEKSMVQVPEGHFWASGDNQPESRDSRLYGPVPLGAIRGKVEAVFWPLSQAKWMKGNMETISEEQLQESRSP